MNLYMRQIMLPIGLLLCMNNLVRGSTIYVNTNGTGSGTSWVDATDLQTALGIASPFDEIWVAGGTYRLVSQSDTYLFGQNIALFGGFDGIDDANTSDANTSLHPTILSGDVNADDPLMPDNADIVLTCDGTPSGARVNGITITGGRLHGVLVSADAALSFESVRVINCGEATTNSGPSSDDGGGMRVQDTNTFPRLFDCTFQHNFAKLGGAISIMDSSRVRAENTVFDANTANDWANTNSHGGAVFMASSTFNPTEFVSCTFQHNLAFGGQGGAINKFAGHVRLLKCTLTDNTAASTNSLAGPELRTTGKSGNGGAVFGQNGPITMLNCTLDGNHARFPIERNMSEPAGGGAVFIVNDLDFQVVNSLFINNDTNTNGVGGAVLFLGDAAVADISNVTMSANHAPGYAGIYAVTGDVLLRNSILWGNIATSLTPPPVEEINLFSTANLDLRNCDIQDDDPDDANIPYSTFSGTSNIDDDPRFIAPGSNYRLRSCSPCIDAADANTLRADEDDLDGNGASGCDTCTNGDGDSHLSSTPCGHSVDGRPEVASAHDADIPPQFR